MKNPIFTTIIPGILLMIFLTSFVSAINLNIVSKQVSNTVITDLNQPAIYDLTITNNEKADNFDIYSLVGIVISPNNFSIGEGETKTIRIYLTPQESLKSKEEPFPFVYQIRNSKDEIQRDTLTISIMSLGSAVDIVPENINPQSDSIIISIKNRATYDFDKLNLRFTSVFFPDYSTDVSLKSVESKTISIPLNKEKLKVLDAGNYLMGIQVIFGDVSAAKKEVVVKFVEQPNIDEKITSEGFIINRQEIIKKNIGNVKQTVTTTVQKSFISYLFTTTNIPPTSAKFSGFSRVYTWQKELIPNDELDVVTTTNWFFPILIIIAIIVVIILIKKYTERDFVFRKTVSFVRTKGGEFALKINLNIKAKKYAERINIIDKLPHLVNLYDKFGAVAPHKVDLNNRRLEWNIESMNKGESRIFSYIIYSSKVGVVGRFELPSAKAVYERNGNIKETTSNRAFFINEPKKNI
jgi:hypothetical protein